MLYSMRYINVAKSSARVSGYDYYKSDRVGEIIKIDDHIYSATVKGSGVNIYHVLVNERKPRKSSCDCPNAKGRMVVCKHLVATYFKAHPDIATMFNEATMRSIEEEERYYITLYAKAYEFVDGLGEEAIKEMLVHFLINDREFIDDYLMDDYEY